MNNRKAQAFMTDFMASVAIFGAILTLFMTMWSLGIDSQTSFNREDMLRKQAERTADFMVTTEGYPSNWEEPGVEVRIPGFAESDNILSAEKIKEFGNLSYEKKKTLTKTQNFTLEFRDPQSGEVLNATLGGGEAGPGGAETGEVVGKEPIAYIVQDGSSLANLEMLDNLNESRREWYFYFPSQEDQNKLSALTAEEVYTNQGSIVPMMERLISDSADKGWQKFRIGERIPAAMTSEIADIDGDGNNEVYYKDTNSRLNYYDFQTDETIRVETVSGFARLGAVDDFTDEPGLELAYIDDNDHLAFYNLNTDTVIETSQNAIDVGDATTISGNTAVFFTTGNNNLAYFSQEGGVTVTSSNSGRVGGVSDIDGDGNTEVAFSNGNDNLAYYDISTGNEEATNQQVVDVGWINNGLTAIVSNNNGYSALWNYTSSSLRATGFQSTSVTDFRESEGSKSFVYVDTELNQDIALYNIDYGFKEYLRSGGSEDIRASDGGWKISIPGYGKSIAYKDGNGNLNFYSIEEQTTLHTGIQVKHIGGSGDLDGDGQPELSFIDNANGNLDYYDFQKGGEVLATEGGSNVRGKDVGVPADVDGDNRDEAVFQDNNYLAYYDYENNQVTRWDSIGQIRNIGGTADIDREGSPEIIYISNQDGDLRYYDPVNDQNTDTDQAVDSLAGGAADITGNPEPEIIYRNPDKKLSYYNPETGTSTEQTRTINLAGSALALKEDEGIDAVVTNGNDRLGYYDYSLSLNYNTVISENAGVQSGNLQNDQILREAVEAGMTYLHSRNSVSILSNTFGMNEQSPGSNTAEIQRVKPLLNNETFSVGEEVSFSNIQGGFQYVDTVFANSTVAPHSCLACMQRFGEGKVYYLADMSAEGTSNQVTFSNVTSSVASNNTDVEEAVNPFNQGLDPIPSAETVIVVDRKVAVNRSGTIVPARMEYVVWR